MDPQNNKAVENQPADNEVQKEQNVEESEQMTIEIAQQLVQLMKDPKVQVKYGSLNAILQYTKTQPSKLLFVDTELFKLIAQNLHHQQLQKICLSTLIHFSSSEKCAEKLVQYIQPVVLDLRTSTGLPQELGLLFLLNVSKAYQFTAKLVHNKNEGQKLQQKQQKQQFSESYALLLSIIYSFMDSKPAKRWVIANIFVNISSHDIGRQYIAKQKLYIGFLKYINDQKQSLRLATLRILRNVVFLWENNEIVTEILKKQNHFIDNVAIHILIMVIKSKLTQDWEKAVQLLKNYGYNTILDYDMEIEPDLEKISTTKEKSINEIQLCVDILIILSNSDFPNRKPQFLKEELKKVISLVTFAPISEQSKDKLEALQTFCFW